MNESAQATYTARVGNGETVEMTGSTRNLDIITSLLQRHDEAAQAHADASAALAANDRDGWDGAATRAEELERGAFDGLTGMRKLSTRIKSHIDTLQDEIDLFSHLQWEARQEKDDEAYSDVKIAHDIAHAKHGILYQTWRDIENII